MCNRRVVDTAGRRQRGVWRMDKGGAGAPGSRERSVQEGKPAQVHAGQSGRHVLLLSKGMHEAHATFVKIGMHSSFSLLQAVGPRVSREILL